MALDRELFPGTTRMHALVREFDWAASSFGPPETWPKSLRALVNLMLASAFPVCLAWGPELRVLYNDAYLPIAGARHPSLFGAPMQQMWTDVWPVLEPILKRALAGEPGFFEKFPVEAVRYGRPSRRWFNVAVTPAQDDEGRVAGLMCIGEETTEQILLERHQAFQLRLSDHLRSLSDPDAITAHASRLLGLHMGVARVTYIEVDQDRGTATARSDWTSGELPSLGGRAMAIDDFGPAAIAQLRAGRTLKVNDSAAHEGGGAGAAAWSSESIGARSMLALPLFKRGWLCALLHVHGTQARQWTEDEVALAEETAERIWAAIERAKADQRRRSAEEELQRSAARQAFQLELSDLLRPLTDPDEIISAASGLLGRHLGVSRVIYSEVDEARGTFESRREWTQPDVSLAGTGGRMDDFGPELLAEMRAGHPVAIDDVTQDRRTVPYADAYAVIGARAFIVVPLVKSGRVQVTLILQSLRPFHWKDLDLQRAEDMAERTWSSLEAAQAQAALRAERDRSQYVLDSMKEGFVLIDKDGIVLQANAESLRLGRLTADQVIGRKASEVWPQIVGTSHEELHRQAKETGEAGSVEYKRMLPNGQAFWMDVRVYPALAGGIAVFYRDISKRKQAEEKLREMDRRKDEFVATLAHELRNPIAPIAAAAEILGLPGIDAADVKRAGEVISRQVGHMTDLVNDLLDISRITSGVLQLHLSQLDVNEIVPESVEQAEPLIRSHAHHLAIHLAPESARLWGDHHRLVQVVANLLINSAKYTPKGGSIALEVQVHADQVVIAVRDNGIGMPADLVESVFDLFAQAQRTSNRTAGGLGIGLALVKGIVELHGGTVTASSPGIGMGSEFRVVLPRLAKRDSA